jgi:hypothetical protein
MQVRSTIRLALLLTLAAPVACKTDKLKPEAANVAAGRSAPGASCQSVGYITGKGGGTFGGEYISNESLIEYAMNDLRNQAAELGADYVQHDPPQLGSGDGTTTSVTITGTAYKCTGAPPSEGMSSLSGAQSKSSPTEDSDGNAGDARVKRKSPPEGAVGFSFGQSPEEAAGVCTQAGHEWTPAHEAHFRCSSTPTAMGLPASSLVQFCSDGLCAVRVTIRPASEDGRVWTNAILEIQKILTQKYGKSDESDNSIPSACRGEKPSPVSLASTTPVDFGRWLCLAALPVLT